MSKKRIFQILDEMNISDTKNGTSNVGVCPDLISADQVKAGAKITMGAPQSAIVDITTGAVIPVLILVNKEEYTKLKKLTTHD